MAIVVDEFRAARGMVILEDILEVVVGDLEDEFDAESTVDASVKKMAERDYVVSGHARIAWPREEFGFPVSEGDYTTLAGLVLGISKTIPHSGAVVRHQDLALTVQRATAQTIEEIRVRW